MSYESLQVFALLSIIYLLFSFPYGRHSIFPIHHHHRIECRALKNVIIIIITVNKIIIIIIIIIFFFSLRFVDVSFLISRCEWYMY